MADAADKPMDPGRELDELCSEIDAACEQIEAEDADCADRSPEQTSDETADDAEAPAQADPVAEIAGELDDLTAAIDELLHGEGGIHAPKAQTDIAGADELNASEDAALEDAVDEISSEVQELLEEAASAVLDESPAHDAGDQPSEDPIAEPADAIDEPADEPPVDAPTAAANEPRNEALGDAPVDDAPAPDRVAEPADAIAAAAPDDAPDPDRNAEPADAIEGVADTPEPAGSDESDSLDDELAAISDALLEQDRVTPGTPDAAPHPLGEEPPEPDDAPEEQSDEPTDESAGTQTPEATDEPEPVAQAQQHEPEPAPEAAPADQTGAEATPGLLERVRAAAVRVWAHVVPLVHRASPHAAAVLLALSKPLDSRPARLRQTIGWLAIYSAFMCVCVWGYIAFVRRAPAPMNDSSPAGIVTPDGPSHAGAPATTEP